MKRRGILAGIVVAGGIALFVVDWGGEECQGAPCDDGFLWKIWVATAIAAIWLVGVVWLAVSVIRAQVRARRSPPRDA